MSQGQGASALYHVRIRGKIYGPYPISKLQELAKKSVVSRINQVSVDGGNSWQPASEFGEIFEAAQIQVTIPQGTQQQAGGMQAGGMQGGGQGFGQAQPTSSDAPWYYLINGQKHGPTSLSQLQMMVSTGTLNPADYACQEGAADWSRVDMVPELMSVLRASGIQSGGQGGGETNAGGFSRRAATAFAASRPWTMMLSIVCFVLAGVLLVFGIMLFFSGPTDDDGLFGIWSLAPEGFLGGLSDDDKTPAFVILVGMSSILVSVAAAMAGVMLLVHSGKIPRFAADPSEKKLVPLGVTLSRLWIYLAVLLTVFTVLFLTWVILMLTQTVRILIIW